jgi:hypothetical protein
MCNLLENRKFFPTLRPFQTAETQVQGTHDLVLCKTCRKHRRTSTFSFYSCNLHPKNIFLDTFVLGGLLVLHLEGSLIICE